MIVWKEKFFKSDVNQETIPTHRQLVTLNEWA